MLLVAALATAGAADSYSATSAMSSSPALQTYWANQAIQVGSMLHVERVHRAHIKCRHCRCHRNIRYARRLQRQWSRLLLGVTTEVTDDGYFHLNVIDPAVDDASVSDTVTFRFDDGERIVHLK